VSPMGVSPVESQESGRAKMALRLMGRMPMLLKTQFSYTL
jgi:hypothetical protein